jgi:hypothetical protein
VRSQRAASSGQGNAFPARRSLFAARYFGNKLHGSGWKPLNSTFEPTAIG